VESIHRGEQGGTWLNYFDKSNDAMKPYYEYEAGYILYCIDEKNKTAGIDFIFDYSNKLVSYYSEIIDKALETAFHELGLNKIYVNVIRDNFGLFHILRAFNFITESIHREQYFDESPHDIVYMTILKGEWEKGGIKYKNNYDQYCVVMDC
jgi:RimJ/RimL family protein N-acetyltransferase